jgi:N-acetylglucosamine-6-sulfatase
MRTRHTALTAAAAFVAAGVLVYPTACASSPEQGPSRGQPPTLGPRPSLELERLPDVKPRNVVLVLADDHRYDAMGFVGHPFIETPSLDRLAREGVHFRDAVVTTALCSPSRASILTGLYAHRHHVVDNNHPVPPDLTFFPQYLQGAGFQTAFFGKWHMGGESDEPQRGFDHWVSFLGQGTYLPEGQTLNVDGKRVPRRGYITDELTDYAVEWLGKRDRSRPFFLYLSHKAVHVDRLPGDQRLTFIAAERHRGRYEGEPVPDPASQSAQAAADDGRPRWVKDQRNSFHGVDFPYYSELDIDEYFRRYAETLLALDESVGRVLDALRDEGVLDSTLVLYLGDNGFAFGEHGLIDKRNAYEESIRIPMVARAPGLLPAGATVTAVAANIDVAPTLLEAAGLKPPTGLDGRSLLAAARGDTAGWRREVLYEYYWERNFPQTPTVHALRGERFKYIRYHGLWDSDELFDLAADPHEMRNLIRDPAHAKTAEEMNARLFELLEETGGLAIPLQADRGPQLNLRRADGQHAADFPAALYVER